MRKLIVVLLAVLVVASLVSCGRASSTTGGFNSERGSGGLVIPGVTAAPATRTQPAPTTMTVSQYAGDSATTVDRMIVRTGDISMIVEDVNAAIDRISKTADQSKGYVVSSNSWRDGERLRGTISIRVPSGDFGSIMTAISQLAVEVTSQTTSSQDVTEEYVDLTAKLKNLQATEQQLLQIMAKAEKVEDILAVERELSNARSQVEQTTGRMQYLEKTATTSLIQVRLEQSKLMPS
jgi:hypothetical protein